MGGMQPAVPGGCQGGGSHGPCAPPSAWGRFHTNGLQLPPWDSAWARKPVAYCLHKHFVAKLNLTCCSGGRSPSSTMSPASTGRAGGGFLRRVPPYLAAFLLRVCSLWDHCPQGVLWPRVGAVFSRAGVGRAGAPSREPAVPSVPAQFLGSERESGIPRERRQEGTVARQQFLRCCTGHPWSGGGRFAEQLLR